jgi:hypothetical protein
MGSADKTRMLRIILERGADFGDEIRKIGFDYGGVWPEKVLQFSLRPYARPTRDQYLKKVKGFRRNVARLTRPKELTGLRIKDKVPKMIQAHGRILGCGRVTWVREEKSANAPMT